MKSSADLLKLSKMEHGIQQKIGCHRYIHRGYPHNITYCGYSYSKPYLSSAKATAIGSNSYTGTRTRCPQ